MSSLYFREDFGHKPKWKVWELDQTMMQNLKWVEYQSSMRGLVQSLKFLIWVQYMSKPNFKMIQWFVFLAWPRVPSTISGERQKKSCQLPACFNIPSHKSADGSLKLSRTVRHIELMWMRRENSGITARSLPSSTPRPLLRVSVTRPAADSLSWPPLSAPASTPALDTSCGSAGMNSRLYCKGVVKSRRDAI